LPTLHRTSRQYYQQPYGQNYQQQVSYNQYPYNNQQDWSSSSSSSNSSPNVQFNGNFNNDICNGQNKFFDFGSLMDIGKIRALNSARQSFFFWANFPHTFTAAFSAAFKVSFRALFKISSVVSLVVADEMAVAVLAGKVEQLILMGI